MTRLIMSQEDIERLERAGETEDEWYSPDGKLFGGQPAPEREKTHIEKIAELPWSKQSRGQDVLEAGKTITDTASSFSMSLLGNITIVVIGVLLLLAAIVFSDLGQKAINTVKPL